MFIIKSDDQRQKTMKQVEGLEKRIEAVRERYGREKAGLFAKSVHKQLEEFREQIRLYDELKEKGLEPRRPEYLSEMGPYLVRARIAVGITQSDLAKELKVSQPMVHKYEDNEYQGVGLDVLSKAAKALGVSLNLEAFRQQGITRYDAKRQGEAILFFGQQINNTYLGRTKLNKLLYYTDYEWIRNKGVSITGETYVAMQFGPVPKHIKETLERLEKTQAIRIEKAKIGNYDQGRYVILRDPDLSVFTSEEVAHLNSVARRFESWTAKQMSDLTHEDYPWQSARLGQEIQLL